MTTDETLLAFLRGSLGAKRDRLLDFVARSKSRSKFIALLYHELGGLFDSACVVPDLPGAAWITPALRFRSVSEFGTSVRTFKSAYDELAQAELVVTIDARYGFWRDETFVDSEILVVARKVSSNR
jgi:hypothetical protein